VQRAVPGLSVTSAWESFSLTVGTGCHTAQVASGGTLLLIKDRQQ